MAWQIGLLISRWWQAIHHGERSLSSALLSSGLCPSPSTKGSLSWPPVTLTCPPNPPTRPCTLLTSSPSLLSLSVSMKKGQCERKNRRVNRGKRSRAFYTRYKYLQKCGWNTWNTHEEEERVANVAAGGFLYTPTQDPHVTVGTQKPTTKSFRNLSVLIIFRLERCWREWRDHPSTRAAALNPGVCSNSPSQTGHWIKSLLLRVTSAGTPLWGRFASCSGQKNQSHNVHVQLLKILSPPGWNLTVGLSPPQMVSVSSPPSSYWQTHISATESGQTDRWGAPCHGCRQRDK